MKKKLIKMTAVMLGVFAGISSFAQESSQIPKKEDLSRLSEKERAVPTNPAIAKEISELKMITEAPKPIVPGGEFKPVDSDKPVAANTKTDEPEKYQPMLMPASKKAGPPPVVTEQHADKSTKNKAISAPLQQIVQKELQ